MFKEEERAKTSLEVLEVVKKFLIKGATQIRVEQITSDLWEIVGSDGAKV